jgi:signal transduction histidine kinase
MDQITHLRRSIQVFLIVCLVAENAAVIALALALATVTTMPMALIAVIVLIAGGVLLVLTALTVTGYVMQPLQALWQAILHLSPTDIGTPAPEVEKLKMGRELVANLTGQIYQMADVAQRSLSEQQKEVHDLSHNFIAQNVPLPFIVLDMTETITFANEAAGAYLGMKPADLLGKNVYMVLDMAFPSEDTFDNWLKKVKQSSATATNSWERVRMSVRDNHPARLFDLAAYYNRANPDGIETMIVLFDHTKQYSQDEQAVSFIALSVHELRTPLTLLRGYIEVFEEEFGEQLNDELRGFMLKMHSQAEQLTAFVNNILNVARVDDDQLELQLQEEDWGTILRNSVEGISLRAQVRGITLGCTVAENLPAVGADRLSIREVINNLIDNAIKYSGTSKVIEVDAHLSPEGLVETTVKDFGLGIPSSVMPNLFTKFYRDHRNRAQIGGTGLGLYLSKAIVTAHGGNMWVRSKEGEGSTFGFTLVPYAQLTEELKRNGNNEITRGAHGWIKNHSLYRR